MTLHEDLARKPYAFDFFDVLRRLECEYRALPRLGRSAKAADDFVRLRQKPTLNFAPAMNAAYQPPGAGQPAILESYFLGLFGPAGPLPTHLTEFAHQRIHNNKDHTFARFADVFHHRILCLFYRAWAEARPVVHFDRPQEDRFAFYLRALSGHATPGLQDRDEWPDRARLYYTGRLIGGARNREGLSALLEGYFGVPTDVVPLVGEWMRLPEADRTRLVESGFNRLGHTAVIGARVFGAQHKFRLRLGPLGYEDFQKFLPGRDTQGRLVAAVRAFVGWELHWDCQLVLHRAEAPALRLGDGAQLGWTSWLAPATSGLDLEDVIIGAAGVHARRTKH